MCFVTCPKQGPNIEGVVIPRVDILGLLCPKQGQGFKPSAALLYPNMGQVPPPLPPRGDLSKFHLTSTIMDKTDNTGFS